VLKREAESCSGSLPSGLYRFGWPKKLRKSKISLNEDVFESSKKIPDLANLCPFGFSAVQGYGRRFDLPLEHGSTVIS
jgi:hypothetical protein